LIEALLIAPPLSQSQLTYGRADFINLQRRTEQEKVSTKDFAIQGFASDLLATVDILTTALKHVNQPISQENKDLVALFNGVEMTRQELLKTLAKHGVTQFDPTGEKFDPNKHEALFQAPIPGKEPGTVLECQKTGFMIKSRTLRPAQVGVVQDMS
jgi:molecular chaperone GrpE